VIGFVINFLSEARLLIRWIVNSTLALLWLITVIVVWKEVREDLE
jgi:hypothetical protein